MEDTGDRKETSTNESPGLEAFAGKAQPTTPPGPDHPPAAAGGTDRQLFDNLQTAFLREVSKQHGVGTRSQQADSVPMAEAARNGIIRVCDELKSFLLA